MTKVRHRLACLACLLAGGVLGQRSFTPVLSVSADDFPAITPAVANPPPARLPASTAAEHLRIAAEHLDAAGQTALAQHVRQLSDTAETSNPIPAPKYGPIAPPQVLPRELSPALNWVPRPVVPPRGRVSIEVPPELDDGSLRFIQPVGKKSDPSEVRTTNAAPPRGPI